MNYYALMPAVSAITNFVICFYVLSKNYKKKINIYFALYAFFSAIWSFGVFFVFIAGNPESAFIWGKIGRLGASFTPSFLLLFVLVFTESKLLKNRISYWLIILPAVVFFVIVIFTKWIGAGIVLVYWGYDYVRGPAFMIFSLWTMISMTWGLIACIVFYKKTNSTKKKKQAKLLIWSIILTYFGGITTILIPSILNFRMVPMLSLFATVQLILISYAITRYGLMGITPAMAANNILKTMTDFMVVVDSEKNIVISNDSLLKATGFTKKEILDKPLNFLDKGRDEIYEKLDKRGLVIDYETTVKGKYGVSILVSVNASVMIDEFKEAIGYVIILRDVRHVKELIESLRKRRIELEETIEKIGQFNELAKNREIKMIELKKKIKELEELGKFKKGH